MRSTLLLLFVTLSVLKLPAQDVPEVTFGQLSDADRSLMTVPGDTSAEAYVLYDRQGLDFEYNETDGPSLVETFHQRIKLLRPSAFERANVSIRYNPKYEKIEEVEGYIHLPTGGTLPVTADQVKDERVGEERSVVKFTFPRVSEGAVIEYRYKRRAASILVPTPFVFQQDIPVRWAQFDAMIPPYYGYITLGTAQLDVNRAKITRRAWGPNFGGGAYRSGQEKIEHSDLLWAKRDLPAFKSQPYTNNETDYLPKIQLQLQSVQYPNRPKQTVFGTWQETVDELQDRQDFGRYYRNKINYAKVWKAFEPELAGLQTDREKIAAAYRFVTRSIGWNEQYRWLASGSPNKVFEEGKGNSADLNILLLSLLNEAGITAHPLLVSLRNTGAPIEQYPLLDQFNHLMVYTEVEGKPLFLDAGDPDRPARLPRHDALNHRGWVGDRDHPRWVSIEVPTSRKTTMVEMDVASDGVLTTKVRGRLENYFAFEGKNMLYTATTEREKPVVREIAAGFPQSSVNSFTVLEGKTDRPEVLDFEAALSIPTEGGMTDYIYLQPVLVPVLEEDLADSEQRTLPIDFGYPWEQQYVATIRLPAGYRLQEAPAPVRIRAEDGSMVAEFSAEERGPELLSVTFKVQLGRTLYTAQEYAALRDMYRRVIDMQESLLVLKRQAK